MPCTRSAYSSAWHARLGPAELIAICVSTRTPEYALYYAHSSTAHASADLRLQASMYTCMLLHPFAACPARLLAVVNRHDLEQNRTTS